MLSYLGVAAISATLGWYAQVSTGEAPAVAKSAPVARLDMVQSDVVLTTSGDLQAQMTVVNYGDVLFRLASLRVDGKPFAEAPLSIGPGESAAVDIPVSCDTVRKRGQDSQIAVEFVGDGGESSQFGYLTPRHMQEACARLGSHRP